MSQRGVRVRSLFALLCVGLLLGLPQIRGESPAKRAKAGGIEVEGPFASQNLAIYLVRGKGADTRKYLTLDEGLRQKTVAVREQGSGRGQDRAQVNELEIENRSDQWLYIQAGDVISGGKQDRTIGTDVAIPPHSPPQPISAFCVEHGRWTARGGTGMAFGSSPSIVGNAAMKQKIQGEKSQTGVWAEVAADEAKASRMVAASPGASATALSSTGTYDAIVQNREIRSKREDYVASLLPRVEKAGDAIGIVVALNGEVTAADVYGSSALFHKLAKKLVESYALEALLARDKTNFSTGAPGCEKALSFLTEASQAAGKDERVGESIHRTTRESQGAVVYEYTDSDAASRDKLLHKNFVKK